MTELQAKMSESDSSTESIQFDYIQEMSSSLSAEVRKSSGTAYFKKPKNLRIDQKGPERQLIVSSGRNVFIYTPRFNQVLKDSWDGWFAKSIFFPGLIGFEKTLEKLKKDYEWKIVGVSDLNGEKTWSVRLTQTPPGGGADLSLWLGEADFIPRKTEVTAGTLKVTTTLVSLERNLSLDPVLFNFRRPPDSDVIKIP